jgi:copper chaperone
LPFFQRFPRRLYQAVKNLIFPFLSTGVKTYNVSLDSQTADITTDDSVSYEQVLEKIKKTGKTVNSGEADGATMAV